MMKKGGDVFGSLLWKCLENNGIINLDTDCDIRGKSKWRISKWRISKLKNQGIK